MKNLSEKSVDEATHPRGTWKRRAEILIVENPEMSAECVKMMSDLLQELVDDKGLPTPAIFLTEGCIISIEWITGNPMVRDDVNSTGAFNVTHIFVVEINGSGNYDTFSMDVASGKTEEKAVSSHAEAVEIISGWDFTSP